VAQYRCFRNTDPPALVEVWNEAVTGRGAVRLRGSLPLEYCVFAKPYFDPVGLVLAEEHGVCVGFVHAGFGANATEGALSHSAGVTCLLAVRPGYRHHGIGSELLRRSEEYLRRGGAQVLYAGPHRPLDPFYLGLYGGSELPGLLDTDADTAVFLSRHGYVPRQATAVFQRALTDPLRLLDPRCSGQRHRFELQVEAPPARDMTWWEICVFGLVEPLRFSLVEQPGTSPVASALVYELESFSWRWGKPSVGIAGLQVRPELRGQGLGKLLLYQTLRYVQDQCFELAEVQVPEENEAAIKMCQALGFTRVDTGRVYQREA
jgi:ribosomal protein S18 acetylase RimI-like enzyme